MDPHWPPQLPSVFSSHIISRIDSKNCRHVELETFLGYACQFCNWFGPDFQLKCTRSRTRDYCLLLSFFMDNKDGTLDLYHGLNRIDFLPFQAKSRCETIEKIEFPFPLTDMWFSFSCSGVWLTLIHGRSKLFLFFSQRGRTFLELFFFWVHSIWIEDAWKGDL